VGQWRPDNDQPGAAVPDSPLQATVVEAGVGVRSAWRTAWVTVGCSIPPWVTMGGTGCSTEEVGLGEDDAGDTGVIVGVPVGVRVGTMVAVDDGVAVGILVGVELGVDEAVAVGVAVAVDVDVAVAVGVGVEVGVGGGPTVADMGS
jgi:hypothetical protein